MHGNITVYLKYGDVCLKYILYTKMLFNVIKYWVKQVYTDGRNYIKQVYNMLTIDMTTIIIGKNSCSLLKNTFLCDLGLYDA